MSDLATLAQNAIDTNPISSGPQVPLATYITQIQHASSTYNVPIQDLEALLVVESGNAAGLKTSGAATVGPRANSGSAYGVAQFTPATAASYGVDVTDVTSSIDGAAKYLNALYTMFGGSWTAAIEAYNAGPGNVSALGINGAAALPGADPLYLQKVGAAAQLFRDHPLPAAGTPPNTAGGVATTPSSPSGAQQTGPGVVAHPALANPVDALTGAITGFGNSAIGAAQNIALEVFVGGLAIALISGGILWMAQSNTGVQSAEGTIVGAAAKAP